MLYVNYISIKQGVKNSEEKIIKQAGKKKTFYIYPYKGNSKFIFEKIKAVRANL